MPTPRQHGGAELVHFPLTTPGFYGLNTKNKNALLGPEWATVLRNSVIDTNGRLAARKGWQDITTTAHTSAFVNIIEYQAHDGTVELVATTATEVVKSTDNGDSWSDVTGTASFTSGQWFLVNFNDVVVGFQDGEQPLLYNGTTSSQISDAGNEPLGGVGASAFGRLWASDSDGVTLQYCALLDQADWSGADTGSFDLTNVWPGTDTIKAIAEHNGRLIVFGEKNILIFGDNTGSALGIDPTQMTVVDTIIGIGCKSQHSIQEVKGDLWFLGTDSNLYALGPLIQEKSHPMGFISKNVADELRDSITKTSLDITELRSAYSPANQFYLLSLPMESSSGQGDEVGVTWVFDTRDRIPDGSARCLGKWDGLVPTNIIVRNNGDVLMSLRTVVGELGKYNQQQDNGNSYKFDYESGWTDVTQQGFLLIPKRITALLFINTTTTATLKHGFDFTSQLTNKTLSFIAAAVGGEFGIGEFGIAEFSQGITLQEKKAPGKKSGEFIKVGMEAIIDGGEVALQQLDLLAKVGRIK